MSHDTYLERAHVGAAERHEIGVERERAIEPAAHYITTQRKLRAYVCSLMISAAVAAGPLPGL
jgi:hypothetical protein